jgi:hypothetical protein
MVLRIIEHMNAVQYRDQRGCVYGYGEFFPQEISPFSYNETIAQEYGPITESEARAGGFIWKTLKEKDYTITLDANDISDHIKDTGDDIINQTIGCLHKGRCEHQCTNAFKIIPAELDFYRQYRLALPRLCPNCRHYSRLAQRNPFKLWDRACDCKGNSVVTKQGYVNSAKHFHGDGPCSNTFRTSYASERSETVYCEQCYQAEVS